MRLARLLAVAALLLAACSGGDGDRLDDLEERVAQLETTPSGDAPVWTVLSMQMILRGELASSTLEFTGPDLEAENVPIDVPVWAVVINYSVPSGRHG